MGSMIVQTGHSKLRTGWLVAWAVFAEGPAAAVGDTPEVVDAVCGSAARPVPPSSAEM